MKQPSVKFGEDRSSGLIVLVRIRNGNGQTDRPTYPTPTLIDGRNSFK